MNLDDKTLNTASVGRLYLLTLTLFVLIVILLFRGCSANAELADWENRAKILESENFALTTKVDNQGREIAETKNTVLTNSKEVQEQLKTFQELKKIETKVVVKTKTVYDTLYVQTTDTVIKTETAEVNAKVFNYDDKWLSFNGLINDSLKIENLVVRNEYTIEQGVKKRGLFKKENVVMLRNENPHVKTEQLQSFTIKDERNWLQKNGWKAVSAALIVGLVLK
jgi:uncharacterized protein YcfL